MTDHYDEHDRITVTIDGVTIGGGVFVGRPGNNVVTGNSGAHTIYGGGGNDWIRGLGGNDILIGGPGDDWLDGDDKGSTSDPDWLDGGPGADWMDGENGADIFIFRPGDSGNSSTDRDVISDFNPGAGDKIFLTGFGDNIRASDLKLSQQPIDARGTAGPGTDGATARFRDGGSAPPFTNGLGPEYGDNRNDDRILELPDGGQIVLLNTANVTVSAISSSIYVVPSAPASEHALELNVDARRDLSGRLATGNTDADPPASGGGNTDADPPASGGGNTDACDGADPPASGGGNTDADPPASGGQTIYGDARANRLDGGAGDDRIYGRDGADRLFGNDGADRLFGEEGDDWLSGRDGADRLYGGAGDDVLFGGAGDDRLTGSDGDDNLYGGPGDDSLYGGAGDDDLYGGPGADFMNGGTGEDVFFFERGHSTAGGGDTIRGYTEDDTLDISDFGIDYDENHREQGLINIVGDGDGDGRRDDRIITLPDGGTITLLNYDGEVWFYF